MIWPILLVTCTPEADSLHMVHARPMWARDKRHQRRKVQPDQRGVLAMVAVKSGSLLDTQSANLRMAG